ncbi:MAG TPA: dihydrodipicolinate synthase family protein [Terracidiphilus sp.]|nr:dihydrodipicolinate synthase family protein [Terracidiphilus sp.]
MLLEGVFAAVTTPFYPDERVYYRKLEANIARYSRSLLAGMVVLGSTGEAVTLSDEETREVLRTAAEAAAPEKVLIAGVSRESVHLTVELAESAAKFQYDAILVRTPSYYTNQMPTEAVLTYFRSIADRSPLPVVLYNIPRFVPYQIPVEVVAELAQHPNIIGIKESSGKLDRVKNLLASTRSTPRHRVTVTPMFEAVTERMLQVKESPREESAFVPASDLTGGTALVALPVAPPKTRTKDVGFQVLTGSVGSMLESLEAGSSGAILAFGACAPQACQEVYLAWKDHDLELAREKQQRIAASAQRIVAELGITGVKFACDFNGYFGGRARLPLLPLDSGKKAEIESLLANIRN